MLKLDLMLTHSGAFLNTSVTTRVFDYSRINLKMLQENLFQLSGQRKWQTYAIISLMQFGRLDEIIVTGIKSIEFTILGSDLNQFQHRT